MNVIARIKATQERNRRELETLALLIGQTIAEVEADVCTPDLVQNSSSDPIGGGGLTVRYRGKIEFWSKIRRWVRCRLHGAGLGEKDGRVVCRTCGDALFLYERVPSRYAEAEC